MRVGTASSELFYSLGERAYVVFPQGLVQPFYDVLKHLGYWLRGVIEDHPRWRAVVIGGLLEDEVPRVANTASGLGMSATILTRYCLSVEDGFSEARTSGDDLTRSYGEMTARDLE